MYSTSSAKKDIDLAYSLGATLFVTKPEEWQKLLHLLEVTAAGFQKQQIDLLKTFQMPGFCTG